jgi:hypothetical protein
MTLTRVAELLLLHCDDDSKSSSSSERLMAEVGGVRNGSQRSLEEEPWAESDSESKEFWG